MFTTNTAVYNNFLCCNIFHEIKVTFNFLYKIPFFLLFVIWKRLSRWIQSHGKWSFRITKDQEKAVCTQRNIFGKFFGRNASLIMKHVYIRSREEWNTRVEIFFVEKNSLSFFPSSFSFLSLFFFLFVFFFSNKRPTRWRAIKPRRSLTI